MRRFYTTDFDEMEEMFDLKKNPDLNMLGVEQLLASLEEFRKVRACGQHVFVCGRMAQ